MNKLLTIVLDIIFIILIIYLIQIRIIPNKYIIIISIVLLIIGIILTTTSYIIKNKVGKIIILLISILTLVLSTISIYYINTTNKLLNNIKDIKEESIYYIIVNKNSNYNELKDLNNSKAGILTYNNDNYNKIIKEINKNISIKGKKYNNINNIINNLYNKDIDTIIMNSNYYNMIVENIEYFEKNTKIIKEISIKLNNNNKITKTNLDKPFNILISGIDTYGSINKVSRSDVNIIMSIDPTNNKILLTSIPRDYYVKLHTYNSYDKLTHAGIYGINESMNTISDLLDTKIDYYIRVNFDTLIQLVDSIGGIDVYSDTSFKTYNKVSFNKGINHLDGKKALAYSRERKVFSEGDRKRGYHQQQVIEAIINKISNSKVLLSNYSNIINSLSNILQTNIPNNDIKKFINKELNNPQKWNIESINLDGYDASNYTYSMPGWLLYVMNPNEETVNNAKNKINEIINNKILE